MKPISERAYRRLSAVLRQAGFEGKPASDWLARYEVFPEAHRQEDQEPRCEDPEAPHLKRVVGEDRPTPSPHDRCWEELLSEALTEFEEEVLDIWRSLRAAEILMEEVALELGKDPAGPALRESLTHWECRLMEFYKYAVEMGCELDLPEPSAEELAWLKRTVELDDLSTDMAHIAN